MITYESKINKPEKYANTTFEGSSVNGVRMMKTCKYSEDGLLEESSFIMIYNNGTLLSCFNAESDYPYSADYLLCEIQDENGLEVSK